MSRCRPCHHVLACPCDQPPEQTFPALQAAAAAAAAAVNGSFGNASTQNSSALATVAANAYQAVLSDLGALDPPPPPLPLR